MKVLSVNEAFDGQVVLVGQVGSVAVPAEVVELPEPPAGGEPSCSVQLQGNSDDGWNEANLSFRVNGTGFEIVDFHETESFTRLQVPSEGRYEIIVTGNATTTVNGASVPFALSVVDVTVQYQSWYMPSIAAPGTIYMPLLFSDICDITDPLVQLVYVSCPAIAAVVDGVMTVKRLGDIP